jgi:hypothetical protein
MQGANKIRNRMCTRWNARWRRWRGYALHTLLVLGLLGVALAGFALTSPPAHAATRDASRPCAHAGACNGNPCTDPQQIGIDCLDASSAQLPGKSNIPNPGGMGNVLFFYTPLNVTIGDMHTQTVTTALWRIMLDAVDVCIILILILNGVRIIVVGTVFRYADAVESLPGVLLALIAAHVSMIFIAFFLGLNNALVSGVYTWASSSVPAFPSTFTITPSDLEFTNLFQNLTSLTNILGLIIKILGLMLLAQIIIRIFLINLYIILAPVGIACWALPGRVGQPLTRSWAGGFVSLALVQFVQITALIVIQAIIASFVSYLSSQVHSLDTTTFTQVLNVAVLWFIFRIPSLFPTSPMRSLVEIGDTMSAAVSGTIATQIATAQMGLSAIIGVVGIGASAAMLLM